MIHLSGDARTLIGLAEMTRRLERAWHELSRGLTVGSNMLTTTPLPRGLKRSASLPAPLTHFPSFPHYSRPTHHPSWQI